MEYKVAGCVARRLEGMTVRGKLDEGSARRLCGRVNQIAIPGQAGALRAAVCTYQEKQAWRGDPRDVWRDTTERCAHAREHVEGGNCTKRHLENGGPSGRINVARAVHGRATKQSIEPMCFGCGVKALSTYKHIASDIYATSQFLSAVTVFLLVSAPTGVWPRLDALQ